jgi:hypothetical protein
MAPDYQKVSVKNKAYPEVSAKNRLFLAATKNRKKGYFR